MPATDPWRLDRLASELVRARHALSVPLARCSAAFVFRRGWFDLGYARASDHARERLGRSGRWVRDLGMLGGALARLPGLARALCGDDGGSPIGRVAAGLIGRCATEATLDAWVLLARSVPIRELRARVAEALAGTGGMSGGGADASIQEGAENEESDDLTQLLLRVPRPLRAAFDEAHRLHEAVEGRPTDRASFVEALVGEASACEPSAGAEAPEPSPADPCSPRRVWNRSRIERYLAEVSGFWRSLETQDRAPESPEARLARTVLHRARFLSRQAGEGKPEDLDTQLRALIALENDLERALGALLAHMAERRAWSALRFSGVGHYGEQRLGMSRAAAESRAWIARVVSRSPALKESYESGRLGHEAVLLLGRLFAEWRLSAPEQAAWVGHAEILTIRRLRDEVARAMRLIDEHNPACPEASVGDSLEELRAACPGAALGDPIDQQSPACPCGALWDPTDGHSPACPRAALEDPLDEHSSARPGAAPDPVHGSSRRGGSVPTDAQWRAFLVRVPGQSRERVRRLCALAGATPDVFPGVTLRVKLPLDLAEAFKALVTRRGLASILLEFVEVWDASPPRASDRIYIRDGWRCTAPGCSSRKNLEDHHIRYRSAGGDDKPGNRTCLCRFHHQQGEHGGRTRVTGTAPLGLKWVLRTGAFQNDRAI